MRALGRRASHPLLGRQALLEDLIQSTESEPVLVLKGGPGLGKSALLRALRDELRNSTSRPVFAARIGRTRTAQEVHHALSAALGFEGSATHEGIVSFLDKLAAPVLLLDELGALSDPAQSALEALFHDCPAATLVAATRQQPTLHALTIEVPPLRTERRLDEVASPAASLLSWVLRRQLEPPADQLATYEAIAHELGGVPLAIELAAPRINALSAQGLLGALKENNWSVVLEGEQGLAALVEQTCMTVSTATVEAAYLASRCPAGWSLSTFPHIGDITQRDALRALDASLVRTEREGYVGTLPPIGAALQALVPQARAYELDATMAEALAERAEKHAHDIESISARGEDARAFFRNERENLSSLAGRAERGELPLILGAKSAYALFRFARVIGGIRVELPCHFLEEPNRSQLEHTFVDALELEIAMLLAKSGALEESFSMLAKLRSRLSNDDSLFEQAVHFEMRTRAIRGERPALDVQPSAQSDLLSAEDLALVHETRAFLNHADERELDAATEHRRAWHHARRSENGAMRARVAYNLGISLMRNGELLESKQVFEHAHVEADRVGASQYRNLSTLAGAMVDIALGEDLVSTQRFEELEHDFLKAGDSITRAMVLGSRGDVLFLRRRVVEALRCYEECLPTFEAAGWKEGIVSCWLRIGACARQLGQISRAQFAQEAVDEIGVVGTTDDQRSHRIWAALLGNSMPPENPSAIVSGAIAAGFHTKIAARAWLASQAHPQSQGPNLWVSSDARVFQFSGHGRHALRNNSPMQGILQALTQQHLNNSQGVLSEMQMLEAGWPGAELDPVSMKRRLSVTLARLRKLGFGKDIEFHERGYRLSPNLRVVWGDEAIVGEV